MIALYFIENTQLGGQMLKVICYISLLATSMTLVGCGQSGGLYLPNEPGYDQRAKFLLYKNADTAKQASDEEKDAPVNQQFAIPTDTN